MAGGSASDGAGPAARRWRRRRYVGPTSRILHYIDRWLPLSAGFVHAQVSRSQHPAVVVSRDPLEHRATFPQRPLISIAPAALMGPDRVVRAARTAALLVVASAFRASAVHAHFGYAAPDVLGLVRRRRLPLVLSVHGDDVTALPAKQPGHYDAIVDAAHAVIVPSRWLAERCHAIGFSPQQVHVIPSGVDTALFTPTALPTGAPTVAFVGRLVEKKGLDVLLRAWPRVRAEVPAARLRVLGDGPQRDLVARAATGSAGIEHVAPDPTRRHGQVRALLREATVVTSPSRTSSDGDAESLLLVNLEAQASGRPVVTTRHGGIPEFVEEGRSALLVDEGDHEALAAALVRVLQDPALAARLGAAGPAVAARHDVERTVVQVDEIYTSLDGRSRRGR